MIVSVSGAIQTSFKLYELMDGNGEIIFDDNYLESHSFELEYGGTIYQLANLVDLYKSEENILAGHTIESNGITKNMITEELDNFKTVLNNLDKKEGVVYYATDGEHTFRNTSQTNRAQFEKYPVYYTSEDYDWEMYPSELEQNYSLYGYSHINRGTSPEGTQIFVGYTEDYLTTASTEWLELKSDTIEQIYYALTFVIVFLFSMIYLITTTGRHTSKDEKVQMHLIDKLYVDLNLVVCFIVTMSWFFLINEMLYYWRHVEPGVNVITTLAVAILMILILSLVRHMKNKTIFKHALLYVVFSGLYRFVKAIYDSGSTGVKIAVVVILYPLITAASLIFFPITIGVAVWFALKQVKKFNQIQTGAKLMNEGNLEHQINLNGTGEFAKLASNINGINENFKQAVHNELKNERMKTELITNVSHDIRTPLTSLITYTDLLKTETDPEKIEEYVEILDQKSKRLKMLTDDLFSAAKASSGDIPVDLQQIDVVALINQGIGEVSDQISEKNFTIKLNYPEEKMSVIADGKLLWRSIENILSNIFNYGLEGSRVYIDITHEGDQTLISFKNISKHELNITEDELMERFKRGDESRSSHGSGLGLSITKSLIENQKGTFEINIDGDLFKSMIYLRRAENTDNADKA